VEKILNQEEIDRLFRAAQGSAPKAVVKRKQSVQDCDFRQAGQLSKDQVQQVTLLHEAFAPNLANSVGAYLRVAFQTTLASVEQLGYNDFLGRLPEQTYLATILLSPLEELASIQLDLPLAFPMIDLLLGGPGQGLEEQRDLTEIEEQILESVVAIICRELQSTWQAVLPLEFKMGRRLKRAQIMSLVSPTERVLNLSFEITLTDVRGNLNITFPPVVSNMLLRKLALQGMVRRRRPSADDAARLRERLLDARFTVQLDLTNIPVRIGDIVDLEAGSILHLRQLLNAPMSINVNGCPAFTGALVSCGPMRGGLIDLVLAPPEIVEKEKTS
jgi:flagellar motor switch protein FliM